MDDSLGLLPGPRFREDRRYRVTAALFDIDNTLVGNEAPNLPTPRFQRAAKSAKEDIHVAVATARPLSKVSHILEAIDSEGLSILCNGAQLYDGQKKAIVAEWPISLESCRHITEDLLTAKLAYWINDDGVDYFPCTTAVSRVIQYEQQRDIWNRDSERFLVPDYKPAKPFIIVVHGITDRQVSRVDRIVAECGDPDLTSFIAHQVQQADEAFRYDVFVVHKRANKKDALCELARRQNLMIHNILVVGDGRNDAVILEAAGIGVAMGNSVPEALAVATFIAPDLEHDGAAIALEYFLQGR